MGARGGFLLLQPIFYGVHFPAPSSRLQESESSLHVPGLLPGPLGFRVLQGEMFLDLQGVLPQAQHQVPATAPVCHLSASPPGALPPSCNPGLPADPRHLEPSPGCSRCSVICWPTHTLGTSSPQS